MTKKPDEDQTKKPEEERPKPATPPTAAEESTGSALLKSVVSASKSLEQCASQLETSVSLLETMRSDSATLSSLTAGVNYYASVNKASQASATSSQKAIAWDWQSNCPDKIPMKDAVRSIRFHAEQTTKASYELVTAAKDIVEVVHGQKETMVGQCQLLNIIAENQKNRAEYLKASVTPGFATPCPPPEHSPPSVPGVGVSPARAGPVYPVAPTGHGTPLTAAAPAYMGFGT